MRPSVPDGSSAGLFPDTIIFFHASRFQWHNNDPDYGLLPELRDLNFTYVQKIGHAILCCVWVLWCLGKTFLVYRGELHSTVTWLSSTLGC